MLPKNFPESHVETPNENARQRRNNHVRFWKMGEATAMTEMGARCSPSGLGPELAVGFRDDIADQPPLC
jgi:hypothetical protein